MVCSHCGATNDAGRKFCAECGTRLSVACAACGADNSAGAKFCGECGTALAEAVELPTMTAPARLPEVEPVAELKLVSVLFADLVGFTALSAERPPEQVLTLLNRVFTAFDRLAAKHGLEKIKTIGDAYMVVGGLVPDAKDHAVRVTELGLRMLAEVGRFVDPEPIDIRIGIHSGPAVAGVIGLKKFIYDVWGDTVNMASRLEGAGVPGRIQVSH